MSLPPGTLISNTAQATYKLGAASGVVSSSNTVTTTTVVVRTPSTLEYLHYAPTVPGAEAVPVFAQPTAPRESTAGPFVPLPAIACGSSTPLDISTPLPLVPADVYHQGDPIIIRLTDLDENLDALAAETVLVTSPTRRWRESELLLLTETGVNTGVFVGYSSPLMTCR